MNRAISCLDGWNEAYDQLPIVRLRNEAMDMGEDYSLHHITAIASLFIGELWADLRMHFEMDPPGTMYSTEELQAYLLEASADTIRRWVIDKEDDPDPRYQRYLRMVRDHYPDGEHGLEQLASGLNTAWIIMVQLVDLLPRLYEHQFGESIDFDRLEQILDGPQLLLLIKALAGSSVDVLYHFLGSFGDCDLKQGQLRFHVEPFQFVDVDGQLYLDLTLSAVDLVDDVIQVVRVRLGCPARIVQGEDAGVIDEMWAFTCKTVKEKLLS